MLASLAIDLLSVCTVMLAFGWAYDVVHGSASVHRAQRTSPDSGRGQNAEEDNIPCMTSLRPDIERM